VYGSLAVSYGKRLDTFFDLSSYLDAKIEAIGQFDCLSPARSGREVRSVIDFDGGPFAY
jgi:hypothetical protein